MELYQIKYFFALCETLNFARAAERCNVSQPSLTRAVQRLEHELGGLLAVRNRHLTHLTELGTLVRPMLNEVVSHSVDRRLNLPAATRRALKGPGRIRIRLSEFEPGYVTFDRGARSSLTFETTGGR